jgi:cystathionine gamma-synthase
MHPSSPYTERDWRWCRHKLILDRFFIHKSIEAFASDVATRHAPPGSRAMLFSTRMAATRCLDFVRKHAPAEMVVGLTVVHLVLDETNPDSAPLLALSPTVSAAIFPHEAFPFAKQYWQHSGDGVSSRRAEFCHGLFKDDLLRVGPGDDGPPSPSMSGQKVCRGPKRYRRPMSIGGVGGNTSPPTSQSRHLNSGPSDSEATGAKDAQETSRFLEERFGRNLDISFLEPAKSAIRRRIAGALRGDLDITTMPLPDMGPNTRGIVNLREEDVYLYPCGMNAIFRTHQMLLAARGSLRSINFGFPYVDTLKILQKFGPGCQFYGNASEADLDDLETRLAGGERFLALFCEFPGNPLLTCPNLVRIRQLADKYDFAVVVDETIGTFANINVIQYADVVVSSLTKIFSGDCNVMGGSAIINPNSPYYGILKDAALREYEDSYWPEDVIFMERNSRDFAVRVDRINANAEAICDILAQHPLVKSVYYPKYNDTRANYEICKLPTGGYGGLLSVVFHDRPRAVAFYDSIDTAKGPSLGTNFTLISPYVLLAHYQELDWAAGFGVSPDLIRVSVGLEETDQVTAAVRAALSAAEQVEVS